MNYSKTYFLYLIKKHYKVVIALFALAFLIFPLPAILSDLHVSVDGSIYRQTDVLLYMGTVVACFSSYLLPIAVRSAFLNRKKCDLYLSLPMKKEKIYLLNSLFVYLAYFVCFSVLFLIVFVVNAIKGLPVNVYYLYYYLGITGISISIFAISSLISSLANNFLDAILMNVTLILSGYLNFLIYFDGLGPFDCCVMPISFADYFTAFCQNGIIDSLTETYISSGLKSFWVAFPFHLVFAPVCFILSYFETKIFKSENAGERTVKTYSYPIVNGLIFSLVFSYVMSDFDPVIILVAIGVYFISEFVYKRKIKVDRGTFIRLAIYLAVGAFIRLNYYNEWITFIYDI